MKKSSLLTGFMVIGLTLSTLLIAQDTIETFKYTDMCDASAAVAISPKLFIVANDEDNALRVYRQDRPGKPIQKFELDAFLATVDDSETASIKVKEVDIEGAARIGDRIYWIASHGANKASVPQSSRQQLFATEVSVTGMRVTLKPVGKPYRNLLKDFAQAPETSAYRLDEAAQYPPEQVATPNQTAGLNIEGLGATPEGALLIAFRNPIPNNKALIIPLNNPDQVVHGQAAQLGTPVLLQLGGLGIRSLDYVEMLGGYLIIAGPADNINSFRLYQWPGPPSETAKLINIDSAYFEQMQPEAFVVYPDQRAEIHILSDDGGRQAVGRTKRCNKEKPAKRQFRSVRISF